jgi:hypothetical protein
VRKLPPNSLNTVNNIYVSVLKLFVDFNTHAGSLATPPALLVEDMENIIR